MRRTDGFEFAYLEGTEATLGQILATALRGRDATPVYAVEGSTLRLMSPGEGLAHWRER